VFGGKYTVAESDADFFNYKSDDKKIPYAVIAEAKGAATSDYQNYLEKTWLEELAKKHTVKVNTDKGNQLGVFKVLDSITGQVLKSIKNVKGNTTYDLYLFDKKI
jgi:hypothetical protein